MVENPESKNHLTFVPFFFLLSGRSDITVLYEAQSLSESPCPRSSSAMRAVTYPPCSHSCRTLWRMASPSGVTRTVSMEASIGPKLLGKRLQPTTCCCSPGRMRPRPRISLNSNGTQPWPCKKASCHTCWIRHHSLQHSAPSMVLMHVCRTRPYPRFCTP